MSLPGGYEYSIKGYTLPKINAIAYAEHVSKWLLMSVQVPNTLGLANPFKQDAYTSSTRTSRGRKFPVYKKNINL